MTELKSVLQNVETAQGLPNAHYTDPETFELERQKVLYANWSGIGFGKDIPEAGDAMPIEFLGMPLLMVRDKEGEINVYQNVCRHRGMILVEEKRKVGGVIRCPYHSWCYSHKGELVNTPHVGGAGHNTHENIKRDELGLIRVRSHVWRDVVFVNVSGDAPAFEDYAKDVIERWKEYEQPIYHGGETSGFKLEVKTNWKLAVENYCESYHLPWVHPGLNSYSRLEDHYNIEAESFSGQGTLVYRQLTNHDEVKFPDHDGLSDKWDTGAEYISLYPNVLLGVHRDHSFAIILEPKGIDQTVEHIELYYAKDLNDDEVYGGLLAKNAQLWKTVFEEDIFVVEGMQKGRLASGFDGGKFSPVMDGPTHCFHKWVATQLESA
jgi:choline monooxygenase